MKCIISTRAFLGDIKIYNFSFILVFLFQGANYENSQIMNQGDINYSHKCACLNTVIFFRNFYFSEIHFLMKIKASISSTQYQWKRRTFCKLSNIWILQTVQTGKNHSSNSTRKILLRFSTKLVCFGNTDRRYWCTIRNAIHSEISFKFLNHL